MAQAGDELADLESPDGSDGTGRPEVPEGSFFDKARWFQDLWRDHMERWPERPPRPDRVRPADPPGSWRGGGDRYLSPEDNAEADRQIDLLRRPEEAVTGLLTRIEHDNPHAGVLVGLDHRLKGDNRLKEKIADKMAAKEGTSVAEAVAMIDDAVRYTFCFGSEKYVTGYDHVRQRLESAGYTMTYCKNRWLDDPQYKGVNSRWESPDGGRFELQFHTRESFYAKEQLTHRSYERLRSPGTPFAERGELNAFERLVSDAIPRPEAVDQIANHRRGSR